MRNKICFNYGWKFFRGAITEPDVVMKERTYGGIKTGELCGIFEDARFIRNFANIRLPHDYVIEDTPDRRKNEAEGFLEGDEAWYCKKFDLAKEDADRCISLYFEGIATESEIFLNGTRIKRNFSAYNPIYIDVTDFVCFDKPNILVVHVRMNEQPEGWWYQGGGIYRDVWLVKTEKIAVDAFGTYVRAQKKEDGLWDLDIDVTVKNADFADRDVNVRHTLLSPDGTPILVLGESMNVARRDKGTLTVSGEAESPLLWDIDSPNLYTVKTELFSDGKVMDEYHTRFGFRTVVFDPDKGFFLNGRSVKLKGFCAHQDYAMTGIYLPKSVSKYRLALMKEMGANAYRSAHNLSDEHTLDLCDEMGVLVFDETRYFASHEEGLSYVKDMLLRDRNHPGVITWSVGNEEYMQHVESGRRICAAMREYIKKFDDRPVVLVMTTAGGVQNNLVGGEVDVIGFNYSLEYHDELHAKYPTKPFVMTESCALQTSRGQYFGDDKAESLFDARDHADRKAWNHTTRTETWRHVMEREYECGMFVWAGIEHRGETLYPRLCSQSGLVDLYLLRKEAFYHTQSHYSEKKMVHICPSTWNFEGLSGTVIPVEVYTNCAEVELFLNGVSLGKEKYENFEPCRWNVTYAPGTLTAVAYDENGRELCRDEVVTTGKAAKLKLICENEEDVKNGGDCALFTCVCLDEKGREVPNAAPTVHFTVSGGELLGTGSSVVDHVRPLCNTRKMYFGKISLAAYMDGNTESVSVTCDADGLGMARAVVERKG